MTERAAGHVDQYSCEWNWIARIKSGTSRQDASRVLERESERFGRGQRSHHWRSACWRRWVACVVLVSLQRVAKNLARLQGKSLKSETCGWAMFLRVKLDRTSTRKIFVPTNGEETKDFGKKMLPLKCGEGVHNIHERKRCEVFFGLNKKGCASLMVAVLEEGNPVEQILCKGATFQKFWCEFYCVSYNANGTALRAAFLQWCYSFRNLANPTESSGNGTNTDDDQMQVGLSQEWQGEGQRQTKIRK